MQPPELWTDRLLTDRSITLFRALDSHELDHAAYKQLVEEVLDPELAFFLKNTYSSLALINGGD